jgi:hypothetical protein
MAMIPSSGLALCTGVKWPENRGESAKENLRPQVENANFVGSTIRKTYAAVHSLYSKK